MKRMYMAGMVLLAVMGLSAAGQSEGGAKATGKPVELEILVSGDTTEGAPMQKAAERFNEAYKDKGIQVTVNEIAYSDLATQINNRSRARQLPALVKNTTATLDQFVDLYYPLDETGLKPADFAMNYSERGGKFIATILNVTSVGMVINKSAWDKAGVTYPTSEENRWKWDEFVAKVKEVQKKTGIEYGFGIDFSQQRIMNILYTFGMRMVDPADSKHLTFRSPETKRGLEFILGLYKDGVSPVTMGTGIDNAQNTFKTGRLAAQYGGNWSLMNYKNGITDFEWTPVLMPYESVKSTCLGGNMLSIFSGTGKEKEAIEFLKWFYTPENYKEYLYDANYLSGLKTIDVEYKLPELANYQEEIKVSDNVSNEDLIMNIEHTGSSYGNTIRSNLAKAIAGEINVDQLMDRVVQDILSAYPDMHE